MYISIYSALLLPVTREEEKGRFAYLVGDHLVNKLGNLRENDHSQRAQLLSGLSVLCECQGAPIQQNQSEFVNDEFNLLFILHDIITYHDIV